MYVDPKTWETIRLKAVQNELETFSILVPAPEHIVALKLHAAKSPTRSKPETDWEEIRQILEVHALDIEDENFKALVLKHGGEESLKRIATFKK